MTPRRRPGLDLIRVAAISLVLVHHFRHLPGAPEGFRWFALRADVGVDLFFVLSGWLIGGQLWREHAATGRVDAWRFWQRRWWRTVPAYLVVLALLVVLRRVAPRQLTSMLVFLQNYSAPDAWLTSWSLCVEEQFYLALPLVVGAGTWLSKRSASGAVALGAASLAVSPVGRWLAFGPMSSGTYDQFIHDYYVVTHLRFEGLACGVLAAWMHANRRDRWPSGRTSAWLAVLGLGLIGLLWLPALGGTTSRPEERMLLFHAVTGFALASLGTMMLLPFASTWETSRWLGGTLAAVADLAYGLYLTHELARDGVLVLLDGQTLPFGAWLAGCLAASLGVAWLLRVTVERPLLLRRKRLVR
jgi:peptidoglycan/LPS O-acetylase OafA/YrhL